MEKQAKEFKFMVRDIMATNDHGCVILHPEDCNAGDFRTLFDKAKKYITDNVCGCTHATFSVYNETNDQWSVVGWNVGDDKVYFGNVSGK